MWQAQWNDVAKRAHIHGFEFVNFTKWWMQLSRELIGVCFFFFFDVSLTSFPGILPNDLKLISLEQENVTVTRSIYQEILIWLRGSLDMTGSDNFLWRQHFLRTFLDLNSHLFEKIIRVCRYDGFSCGQWEIKWTVTYYFETAYSDRICSGFFNFGSFLTTLNNSYYSLMPNSGIWNPMKQNNINDNPQSFGLYRFKEILKWNVALIILIKY